MVEVRLSAQALHQLGAIADYISETQGLPRTADEYVDRIYDRCRQLADFPLVGRLYETSSGQLRTVPFESVMIVYRVSSRGVRILAIFNQRQDYGRQLRQLR